METKHQLIIWQLATVGLIILFSLLIIKVSQIKEENTKQKELIENHEFHAKELNVRNEMLETAILNIIANKNFATYPVSMQKMITAAKDGHKIDFNFYIRMMQEENLKNKKP